MQLANALCRYAELARIVTHREIDWLYREQIRVDRSELRQRALVATNSAGHAKDLVATAEAVDARADQIDDASEIQSKDGGQRLAGCAAVPACILRSSGFTPLA